MAEDLKKVAKVVVIGGSSSAAVCMVIGLFFGRAAIFAGVLPGIGAPAAIALAFVGGVAGAIGGVAVDAAMDAD